MKFLEKKKKSEMKAIEGLFELSENFERCEANLGWVKKTTFVFTAKQAEVHLNFF